MADLAVVPVLGCEVPNITVTSVVTNAWLHMCTDLEKLLPVDGSWMFTPIVLKPDCSPLIGCVLSISGYSGVEREVIVQLSTMLSAVCQDYFVRRGKKELVASTHLVVNSPEGSKYEAARKWGLPAVTCQWLVECARVGQKLDERLFDISNPMPFVRSAPVQRAAPVQHSVLPVCAPMQHIVRKSAAPDVLPKKQCAVNIEVGEAAQSPKLANVEAVFKEPLIPQVDRRTSRSSVSLSRPSDLEHPTSTNRNLASGVIVVPPTATASVAAGGSKDKVVPAAASAGSIRRTHSAVKSSDVESDEEIDKNRKQMNELGQKNLVESVSSKVQPVSQVSMAQPTTLHMHATVQPKSHLPTAQPTTLHLPTAQPTTPHLPTAQPTTPHLPTAQPTTPHLPTAQPTTPSERCPVVIINKLGSNVIDELNMSSAVPVAVVVDNPVIVSKSLIGAGVEKLPKEMSPVVSVREKREGEKAAKVQPKRSTPLLVLDDETKRKDVISPLINNRVEVWFYFLSFFIILL